MSTKIKKINELKVPELKAQCKSLQIPNYSKMKKNDLVEALTKAMESCGLNPKTYRFGEDEELEPRMSDQYKHHAGDKGSEEASNSDEALLVKCRAADQLEECKSIEEDTEDPALDKGNTLDVSEEMTSDAQQNAEMQVETPNRASVGKEKQHKFKPVSIAEDALEAEVWVLFVKRSHAEGDWSDRMVGAYDSKELAAKAVTRYFDKDRSHIGQAWRDLDDEEFSKYFVCYDAEKLVEVDRLQTLVAYKRGEEAVNFAVKMVEKNVEVCPLDEEEDVFDEDEDEDLEGTKEEEKQEDTKEEEEFGDTTDDSHFEEDSE